MNTRIHRSFPAAALGIALLAATLVGGPVSAKSFDEITVQASRLRPRQVGLSYTGIPIEEISLSVLINTAGLNLATPAGLSDVQKRIHAASRSACAEISRPYPQAVPGDRACAAAAERVALEHVEEFAAGAPTRVRVLEFTLPAAAS
jgi:UrcA family protein